MKKVKITVLRTAFYEDLAREYGVEGLAPCSIMKEGQIFYADRTKPDGFCDGAWRSIYQYVFALANGGGKEGFFITTGPKNPAWQ